MNSTSWTYVWSFLNDLLAYIANKKITKHIWNRQNRKIISTRKVVFLQEDFNEVNEIFHVCVHFKFPTW